jgi:hypothetical protein
MPDATWRAASWSRPRWLAVLAVVVAGCLAASPARGDESTPASGVRSLVEAIDLSGSLRGAYWTSSRTLDGREDLPTAALWLRGRWDLGSSVALVVDGSVRNDDLFHARDTGGTFREGYLDARAGPLEVRVGKQIIAWGRADRINPTDNLTPRDFTLLVPEDGDQRFGTTGVRATYHAAGTAVTGIVLPTFEPHVIPLRRPPAPSTLRERVPDDPVLQGAVKIERAGGRVDWSLSYFDGIDLFPDLHIERIHASGLDLALRHHRIRVVGADAAAPVGPYTIRGEAAYTFTEHARRGDQIKSPFFFLVLGADRTMPGAVYLNVQYLVRVVSDFQDPDGIGDPIRRNVAVEQALINDQLDPVKHAVAVRVSRHWLDETLAGELTLVISPNRWDYAVRPKITYAVTDRLKVTAGASLFRGDTVSIFGRLRDTSTAYVEVRWDL